MEWVFIIAIGFICIACPILILLYLEWMPWYVSVLFAVWILASIGTIAFTKSKEKKWYGKLIPTFIFTLIFTIVFMASMDTDHYMFDENTGLWVVAPALSIPAFYGIGGWLNGKWLARQDQKRNEYNGAVDKEIKGKLGEIQELDHAIKDKTCMKPAQYISWICWGIVAQMLRNWKVIRESAISREYHPTSNASGVRYYCLRKAKSNTRCANN